MARRGEEKTIKVSADVADLQRAFENVERAYADVSQASKDYARAVEASAKAVTDEEKAIAKEVERTTKAVLQASKQRASALKSVAAATKEQQKAFAGLEDATKSSTKATKESSSATKDQVQTLNGARGAAMALGVAAIGLATKFRDYVKAAAEAKNGTESARQEAQRMVGAMEGIETQAAQTVVEIANLGASLAGMASGGEAMERIEYNVGKIRQGFALLNVMVRDGVGAVEAYGTMVEEVARADYLAKMNKKYQDGLKENEELEAKVAKNVEDRMKSAEEGERRREKQREDNARKRADAARRRAEEQRKLDEEDRKAQEAAEIELILAQAEAERLNAQEEAVRVQNASNAAVAMGIQLAKEKADEDKKEAKRLEEEAELRRAVTKAALEGAAEVGEAALRAADMDVAATVLSSAAKVGFYTAESIAAFGAANPVSGIAFATAAAQHAIVAGGALAGGVGGGGGGGAKSPSSPPERMISSAPIIPMAEARETAMVVNVNTLSYISPEDARRIGMAEARETRATVGGRPR